MLSLMMSSLLFHCCAWCRSGMPSELFGWERWCGPSGVQGLAVSHGNAARPLGCWESAYFVALLASAISSAVLTFPQLFLIESPWENVQIN